MVRWLILFWRNSEKARMRKWLDPNIQIRSHFTVSWFIIIIIHDWCWRQLRYNFQVSSFAISANPAMKSFSPAGTNVNSFSGYKTLYGISQGNWRLEETSGCNLLRSSSRPSSFTWLHGVNQFQLQLMRLKLVS